MEELDKRELLDDYLASGTDQCALCSTLFCCDVFALSFSWVARNVANHKKADNRGACPWLALSHDHS